MGVAIELPSVPLTTCKGVGTGVGTPSVASMGSKQAMNARRRAAINLEGAMSEVVP
jgi:hypothetical protein